MGLRQPSLLHYFSSKEQIFEVLLDRSVAPALELVEKLEMVVAEPEVKLYALAYHDSSSITTRDLNVPSVAASRGPPGALPIVLGAPQATSGLLPEARH